MRKNKPPCIRNLDKFRKLGCPEKQWDGEEGCTCWIELDVAMRKDPDERKIKRQCLDMWLWEFNWSMLGLLEGNQRAVESFRNGMLQQGPNAEFFPKPDPATVALLSLFKKLEEKQRLIFEHETKKMVS